MAAAPQFSGVHFWVRNMEATLAFYRLVGFELGESSDPEFLNFQLPTGQSFAFGSDALTRRYDPAFDPPPAGKSALALQFDLPSRRAVDEMYERVTAAGHASHLAPIDAFWRKRYCEVMDPDGNVVGFHGADV